MSSSHRHPPNPISASSFLERSYGGCGPSDRAKAPVSAVGEATGTGGLSGYEVAARGAAAWFPIRSPWRLVMSGEVLTDHGIGMQMNRMQILPP